MSRLSMILAINLAGTLAILAAQAPDRPAVFTSAQAEAGRIKIQKNSFGACTDCHTTTLNGRDGEDGELPSLGSLPESYQKHIHGNGGKVPDLVGTKFRKRWAARTTTDLSNEFQLRFAPPSGQLSEETRLDMIAYILQANGALPGTQPLTMATDVGIGALVSRAAEPR